MRHMVAMVLAVALAGCGLRLDKPAFNANGDKGVEVGTGVADAKGRRLGGTGFDFNPGVIIEDVTEFVSGLFAKVTKVATGAVNVAKDAVKGATDAATGE